MKSDKDEPTQQALLSIQRAALNRIMSRIVATDGVMPTINAVAEACRCTAARAATSARWHKP